LQNLLSFEDRAHLERARVLSFEGRFAATSG
jgi:hypothetical protein